MADPEPTSEPIALIGSACRFAGSIQSPQDLWEVASSLPLPDFSRTIPNTRFNIQGFFHNDAEHHGTTNSPKAYFLEQDHRAFDASFFNITPKEAEAMDPQQRLLLEVAFEALESAGYKLSHYAGQNVAVYVGSMTSDYDTLSARDELNSSQYAATGNARSILSNRVSYFFDFRGPSMTIDTACSSSLVALHQAIQSLRSGESPMACVAGVNMLLTPEQFITESNLHMISPTGHCRMWDAKADGYARGEGIAAFFVKTLSRALVDGDQIQAIIRETGVNSDGRSQGITRPSPAAQTALIRATYRKAGLDPKNPDHRPRFFEAHGTGTSVGDPLEAQAIRDAFFDKVSDPVNPMSKGPVHFKLPVGSVKTIIGHTEGAAGLAGVLKVVQSLDKDWIIPNLHLDSINPQVLPFCENLDILTKPTAWVESASGQPRRASVNSFGFGGTNCHAIIEKYEPIIHDSLACLFNAGLSSHIVRPPDLLLLPESFERIKITLPLVFSAATHKSLISTLEKYAIFLKDGANRSPECLAWHLFNHQTTHALRKVIVMDKGDAPGTILSLIKGNGAAGGQIGGVIRGRQTRSDSSPKILGVFTGQGAQYATMSKGLFQINSVYRDTMKVLDDILQACPDPPAFSIAEELMKGPEDSRIHTANISQVICCALQIGLVEFLHSIGVSFTCVLGHSSGEIGAAYAAGRITQRDAILVSYYRGKYAYLATGNKGVKGGMAACGMSKTQAEDFCSRPNYRGRLVLAASNSSRLVTLSGDLDAVKEAVEDLTADGIFVRQLKVDTGYHSFHMRPVVQAYSKSLDSCGIETSLIGNETRWISTVSGREILCTRERLATEYWGVNMLKPVLFHEAVNKAILACGPFDSVVEVGPHPALKTPLKEIIGVLEHVTLPYTGILDRTREDHLAVADFLGFMWANLGPSSIDMGQYIKNSPHPEIINHRFGTGQLLTYPWDHSLVHWRESRLSEQYHFRTHSPHELLGVRTRDDNSYEMRWRNILTLDSIPWVTGHKFQGQALLPASAYCIMAFAAAEAHLGDHADAPTVIELENLEFLSGITIEPESLGVEILFTLTITSSGNPRNNFTREGEMITASFTLTSAPVKPRSSPLFPMMTKNFQGNLRIIFLAPPGVPPRCRPGPRAESLPVKIDSFYQMMNDIGLNYTGPFRALKSLDRRLDYAAATLDMLHPTDTTKLSISPATLDTCFQATFATFSSPGDRALWSSFLPTSIDKIRLFKPDRRLATFSTCSPISVESHLTNSEPYTQASTASITSDISIYHANEETWIEVEGLKVTTFAPKKPENDYELYLHTVLDVDPEDEIVMADPCRSVSSAEIVKSCRLVACHFRNKPQSTESLNCPAQSPVSSTVHEQDLGQTDSEIQCESKDEMGQLMLGSRFFSTLSFIRDTCQSTFAESLPTVLDFAFQEAEMLIQLQQQLSRIMQQIAHRFPRMSILGLTDPSFSLQESILCGLQQSFHSYRIGQGIEDNLANRMPNLNQNKVIVDDFDLEEQKGPIAPAGLYDMVVLSTSAFKQQHQADWTPIRVLNKIQEMTKTSGFLILIHVPPRPVNDRPETIIGRRRAREVDVPPTPPVWVDWLEQAGFVSRCRNADQTFPLGSSLSVRQAHSALEDTMQQPLSWGSTDVVIKDLLIIGGKDEQVLEISAKAVSLLGPHCSTISRAVSLDKVSPVQAANCTVIILLSDLEEPVAMAMNADRIDVLKQLARPGIVLLWVTKDTGVDAERAASMGLTRTLKAEVPGLLLQILDLDAVENCHNIIFKTIGRLIHTGQASHKAGMGALLWSHESEVHIKNGKRMIPRVLPYGPANARVNTYRRPVTHKINTSECRLIFREGTASQDGSTGYEEYDLEPKDMRSTRKPGPDTVHIRVEYSSPWVMRLGDSAAMYLSFGKDVNSGQAVLGLSSEQASIVHAQESLTRRLPMVVDVDMTVVVATVSKMVFAIDMINKARARNLVLVDPDRTLVQCLTQAHLCGDIHMHFWTTSDTLAQENDAFKFVNPWSSSRDIKQALPESNTVWAFLPETSQLCQTLATVSPGLKLGYSYPVIKDNPKHMSDGFSEKPSQKVRDIWDQAVTMSLQMVQSEGVQPTKPTLIAPSRLLERNSVSSTAVFSIIDWKMESWVTLPVRPHIRPQALRADRTYILVGLTRDFGQSLCRLFLQQGAQHMIIASRNPDPNAVWIAELNLQGANILVHTLDVTRLNAVELLKSDMEKLCLPPVGGVVNGAMVLEDRVFVNMDIESWDRVLGPKVTGSRNLDVVFGDEQLDFFIMASSFAAIGGHAGQASYATANMFMNGLAANRRSRGLAGSVLNIGVIYGLGLLARERQHIYNALERDGYPPISERDIHHMFLEAIEAGRPTSGKFIDLTTGLARYRVDDPSPQHWHLDERFSHFTKDGETDPAAATDGRDAQRSVKTLIKEATSFEGIVHTIQSSLCSRMDALLQLPEGSVRSDSSMAELGVDSLAAVEIRQWFYKVVGQNVAVMKILGASSILHLCQEVAGEFPRG